MPVEGEAAAGTSIERRSSAAAAANVDKARPSMFARSPQPACRGTLAGALVFAAAHLGTSAAHPVHDGGR